MSWPGRLRYLRYLILATLAVAFVVLIPAIVLGMAESIAAEKWFAVFIGGPVGVFGVLLIGFEFLYWLDRTLGGT